MTRNLAVLLALSGSVLLNGCSIGESKRADAAESQERRDVLRVGVLGMEDVDLASIDLADPGSVLAADLLYDGLTRFRSSSKSVVGALAEKWETTDGVNWSFTLRTSALFADGSQVLAADVVNSLNAALAGGSGTLAAGRLDVIEGATAVTSGASATAAGIVAESDSVLRIKTVRPYFDLPSLLADPSYGVGKGETSEGILVNGSGPFVAISKTENVFNLEARDGADVRIDAVELHSFTAAEDAVSEFDQGNLEIAIANDEAVSGPKSTMVEVSAGVLTVVVNASRHPTISERIGILTGIDHATTAGSVQPGPGDEESACPVACPTDQAALEGLKAATQATPLQFGVLAGPGMQDAGQEITNQLSASGLGVTLRVAEREGFLSDLASGADDLVLFAAVGLAPTPGIYLSAGYQSAGAENISGFRSAELDAALITAEGTQDVAARAAAYAAIERTVLAEGIALPIRSLSTRFLVSNRVSGVTPGTGTLFDSASVGLDR